MDYDDLCRDPAHKSGQTSDVSGHTSGTASSRCSLRARTADNQHRSGHRRGILRMENDPRHHPNRCHRRSVLTYHRSEIQTPPVSAPCANLTAIRMDGEAPISLFLEIVALLSPPGRAGFRRDLAAPLRRELRGTRSPTGGDARMERAADRDSSAIASVVASGSRLQPWRVSRDGSLSPNWLARCRTAGAKNLWHP